jgi:hypothetical protein
VSKHWLRRSRDGSAALLKKKIEVFVRYSSVEWSF